MHNAVWSTNIRSCSGVIRRKYRGKGREGTRRQMAMKRRARTTTGVDSLCSQPGTSPAPSPARPRPARGRYDHAASASSTSLTSAAVRQGTSPPTTPSSHFGDADPDHHQQPRGILRPSDHTTRPPTRFVRDTLTDQFRGDHGLLSSQAPSGRRPMPLASCGELPRRQEAKVSSSADPEDLLRFEGGHSYEPSWSS